MKSRVLSRRVFRSEPFRFYTSVARELPHFLIIGAQKSGTTSLYQYLLQHPQVLGAAKKEIFYFDFNFDKGILWYRRHFPLKTSFSYRKMVTGKPLVTGEATPDYLAHPQAAERIKKTLPDVRLIALLRNPVHRAISQYFHEVRHKTEFRSLTEAIKGETKRLEKLSKDKPRMSLHINRDVLNNAYLSRGIYVEQLKNYHKHFPRHQLLIINSEEFFSNTQAVYNRVLEFLGLNTYKLLNIRPYKKGEYQLQDSSIEAYLQQFFKPYNDQLFQYLNKNFNW